MTPFEKAVEAVVPAIKNTQPDGNGAASYLEQIATASVTAALTALESEGWGAALTDACQLLDSVKMDWSKTGEWSAWDQSVRDRLSAMNVELYRAMLASRPKTEDGNG